MDNGPEFIVKISKLWSEANEIDFKYIQPGKPSQNAYIERFNRTYRGKVLDACLFDSLDEVRDENGIFMYDYNYQRPHDSLGGLPLAIYRKQLEDAGPIAAVGDFIYSSPLATAAERRTKVENIF